MPDSKISQLESADKIYDHDLMVVVTGYNTVGSYPENRKISLDRIRKDIIRLDEMLFFISGFSGYYNTGENLFYITSHQQAGNLIKLSYPDNPPSYSPQIIDVTGLNAVVGNNIEIQFHSGTPAANFYGGIGPSYYSGIISTTGLNAKGGNLIACEFESNWPHSGVISTTGLNFIASTGIQYQVDPNWPHKYSVSQLDLSSVSRNNAQIISSGNILEVLDPELECNINWGSTNSMPLIENSNNYCYIIDFFIGNFYITLDLPDWISRGRPVSFINNAGNQEFYSWPNIGHICNEGNNVPCVDVSLNPPKLTITMNGNDIYQISPVINPVYSGSVYSFIAPYTSPYYAQHLPVITSNNLLYKYIEKRTLNSNTKIQPEYRLEPAQYSVLFTAQTSEGPYSWYDAGSFITTLHLPQYRYIKLDFARFSP